MDDTDVIAKINSLVEEEHTLARDLEAAARPPTTRRG